MKFKKLNIQHSWFVKEIIFFTETKKTDFTWNFLLNLVQDQPAPDSVKKFNVYELLPRKVTVSDRYITFEVSSNLPLEGFYYE